MKIEIKELTTITTQTQYITRDGEVFTCKETASRHEQALLRQSLETNSHLVIKKDGFIPYEEWVNYDNNQYDWVKPLDQEGVEILLEAYPVHYGDTPAIGEWICYEISDGECYSYDLKTSFKNFFKMTEFLGYNVIINPTE